MKKSTLFGIIATVVGAVAVWFISLMVVGFIFGLLGFDEYQADQYFNWTFIISIVLTLLGGAILGFLGFSIGKNLDANNKEDKKDR